MEQYKQNSTNMSKNERKLRKTCRNQNKHKEVRLNIGKSSSKAMESQKEARNVLEIVFPYKLTNIPYGRSSTFFFQC